MPGIVFLVFRLLLLLALFGFLVWAFFFLWRDLQQHSHLLSANRIPPILLQSENDQDRQARVFSHPQVTIGRNPTCDLVLEAETISAMHARLSFQHNQWWLEDLDSTNGTFINEERITQPVVVARNDCIRLGDIKLSVQIDD